MKTVNMREAKTQLARLVREVCDGTEAGVIITVHGVPTAFLVPYAGKARRVLGIDRGLVTVAGDFDAPDAEIAATFEAN